VRPLRKYRPPNKYTSSVGNAAINTAALCSPYIGSLVIAALTQGAAPLADLVPRAYPDVLPAIYPLAARSLLAHLGKLRDEGRAVEVGGAWSLAA